MADLRRVVILLFNDVEDLDFAGPLEIFGVFGRPGTNDAFEVVTVGESGDTIKTRNGLVIQPTYTFPDCPSADILVIPGGVGTRREIDNPAAINWVKQTADDAELVLTVCTGSLMLAKAGLLDGLGATTHFSAMDLLAELAPTAQIRAGERFIDNGRIIVSAGVSAGIDAALHVVGRLFGPDKAEQTANYIEYEYYRPAG